MTSYPACFRMPRCAPSRSRNPLGVTSTRAAMPLPPAEPCRTGPALCAGILPSFAKHLNQIIIFVPGACPVVSPPRNGLWYTPHAASVHTPAAPPCPVRNAARPELSDVRPGLPGLDRSEEHTSELQPPYDLV